jgi:hypothetical protein
MTPQQLDRLEKIAKLKESGALTQEQFEVERRKIVGLTKEEKADQRKKLDSQNNENLEKLRKILTPISPFIAWFFSVCLLIAGITNWQTPTYLFGAFIAGLIILPPFDKFLKTKSIQIPFWGKIIIFFVGASIAGSVETKQEKMEVESKKKGDISVLQQTIKTSKESKKYGECVSAIGKLLEEYPEKESEYKADKEFCTKQNELAVIEQLKKDKITADANAKLARKAIETTLRNNFLDKNLDIKVSVSGKNNERIKMTYALFSDVWSHQLQKNRTIDNLCQQGFKRVEMSDNYNWSVYWDCK